MKLLWGEYYGLRCALSSHLRNFAKPIPGKWIIKAFPDQREYTGITFLFPEAKFLYIYRNGIDVIASMKKFGWFANQTFEVLCNYWVSHMERYFYLLKGKSLVARFEDFVQCPESVLDNIFRYLSIEKNNKPVEFARSRIIYPLDQPDMNASPKDILSNRPPTHTKWINEQKHLFKNICGSMMVKYSYDIPF